MQIYIYIYICVCVCVCVCVAAVKERNACKGIRICSCKGPLRRYRKMTENGTGVHGPRNIGCARALTFLYPLKIIYL